MSKKNLVCGILHLSSRVSYGLCKNGSAIKKFTAFKKITLNGNSYRTFHVKTKKSYNARDIYCIIRPQNVDTTTNIVTGTIDEYIGEVGNRQAEIKYIKMICIVSWANDKIFSELYLNNDIYSSERKIFRDCDIYSIDPYGCNDIDDAIHVRKINIGAQSAKAYHATSPEGFGYEIGIHIADVSSYIQKGSILDIELSHRCETIYLKDNQINMMPLKLVERCSLIEKIPKRVFSVIIIFNNKYEIIDIKFDHYMINVTRNLTYKEAQNLIDNREISTLNLMYDIGKYLFDTDYVSNKIDKLFDTHKMVEVYMVLANTIVAEHISRFNKDNILLRSHAGIRNEPYKSNSEIPSHLIDKANILLMSKAQYCSGIKDNFETVAHIGLGKKLYTHFSSPIRRYIDIIIHRMLSNDKDNYEELVNHINEMHKLYDKCEKISYQLDKIYQLEDVYGDIIEIKGNIIEINEKHHKVKIYIKDLDIVVDSSLFSDNLYDLVNISKIKIDDLETIKIESKNHPCTVHIRMFQEVKIKIAIMLSIKYKLLTKIVDPDIMSLFDIENYKL